MSNIELTDFEVSAFGRPNTPGVYAVWVKNLAYEAGLAHLLYIGSSNKIGKRLENMQHPYRVAFNRLSGLVYVSFIETEDRLTLEAELIKRHRPILNIQGKK